jgi:hypothetical protein
MNTFNVYMKMDDESKEVWTGHATDSIQAMLVALNYADKHFEGTVIDFDIEEECHVELGR